MLHQPQEEDVLFVAIHDSKRAKDAIEPQNLHVELIPGLRAIVGQAIGHRLTNNRNGFAHQSSKNVVFAEPLDVAVFVCHAQRLAQPTTKSQ